MTGQQVDIYMRTWFTGIFKDGIPCSRYLPTFEVSLIYFESSDGFWQCCRQLCRQHIVSWSIVSCLANRCCKREILQGQERILWVFPKLPLPLTILFPSIITFWLLPPRKLSTQDINWWLVVQVSAGAYCDWLCRKPIHRLLFPRLDLDCEPIGY